MTLANGLLVILVLLCGFAGRDGLRPLAIGFAATWLLFVTSWHPDWSAAFAVARLGWQIEPWGLWALTDAVMGMTALSLGMSRWWGWALWSSYVLQCVMHVAFEAGWTWAQYKLGLDAVFLLQVSIFVLAGGKGALDYGKRLFADRGGRLRAVRLGSALHSAETVSGD